MSVSFKCNRATGSEAQRILAEVFINKVKSSLLDGVDTEFAFCQGDKEGLTEVIRLLISSRQSSSATELAEIKNLVVVIVKTDGSGAGVYTLSGPYKECIDGFITRLIPEARNA